MTFGSVLNKSKCIRIWCVCVCARVYTNAWHVDWKYSETQVAPLYPFGATPAVSFNVCLVRKLCRGTCRCVMLMSLRRFDERVRAWRCLSNKFTILSFNT